MTRHHALKATLTSLLLLGATGLVQAQEVKVGINLPYTGIGAEFAQQIDRGMEQYLKLNADAVKPYTLKLIKRDVKNPGGADAKIAVQELLTQDKVDVLGGWVYSPNAIASAPIVAAGKKLAVIMNAGTAFITNLAPEYVRTSFSMWHAGYGMGEAAAKIMNVKTAVVGYTDFPPGKDSLDAFKRGFEANGGKVLDAIPMGGAGAVPDFTPFFQRAKDQKPDVFFVFVPAGDHAAAVVKTYGALGMRAAGIKLIGPGDITQDTKLQAMGPAAVGLITMHHYNADLDNPENKRLVAGWKKDYGADSTPDFMAVGGYNGMAAIVHAVQATKGKMGGEEAVASLKGWKFNSPQGPISIDPATRDIIMNEYLAEVVMGSDNKLHQKVIGKIDNVKDTCKELKIGPCAPKN
ncbi:MAG TPA: ABC transporter substrate-binding protein [Xanthobacteraceae bacterium]|nr:ABC transporter substrate-binding protein [Xanthobacteraceae bacterium]